MGGNKAACFPNLRTILSCFFCDLPPVTVNLEQSLKYYDPQTKSYRNYSTPLDIFCQIYVDLYFWEGGGRGRSNAARFFSAKKLPSTLQKKTTRRQKNAASSKHKLSPKRQLKT